MVCNEPSYAWNARNRVMAAVTYASRQGSDRDSWLRDNTWRRPAAIVRLLNPTPGRRGLGDKSSPTKTVSARTWRTRPCLTRYSAMSRLNLQTSQGILIIQISYFRSISSDFRHRSRDLCYMSIVYRFLFDTRCHTYLMRYVKIIIQSWHNTKL